ncbi:delphilin [Platysternon megacephalum]|uniref:Delphilin n=1 Tax=Platysternon megacephalum TaxID=55544 RepID=A0A4D9EUJ5_9SAUR|nr:delphilin [Platysternon megacephalum]
MSCLFTRSGDHSRKRLRHFDLAGDSGEACTNAVPCTSSVDQQRFMRSALLPRSDMVCSCMSFTFGILVLLCPFGLTRPVFVSYWCNIHAVRGRVKLFATEETVAKQEEEEEEEEDIELS